MPSAAPVPRRLAVLGFAGLWLAAAPALAQSAPGGIVAGDAARGEEMFRRCAACHTLEENGRNKAGPRLFALFGRRAGTVADFKYSPALRDSTLVWTPQTVDALFAQGPDRVVPGSKMPLQTMADPKDRADLIAFLQRATGK